MTTREEYALQLTTELTKKEYDLYLLSRNRGVVYDEKKITERVMERVESIIIGIEKRGLAPWKVKGLEGETESK